MVNSKLQHLAEHYTAICGSPLLLRREPPIGLRMPREGLREGLRESGAGYDLPHGWIYNHQAARLNRHEAIARYHLAASAVVPIDRDRRPLNALQLANGPGLGRGAAFAAGSPLSGPQASAAGKFAL
ncbi:predicted protein [Histoplasma capsulatum var. duboisii H88]|uniref:Predicted protein n=1 Tax=Ajellomyces capsulatus (strain H88) TaxID=544711 RepID=F0UU10_AJEC8|nr:predicted protein [Histoplasma capsulatum var. duboisii H88]